MDEVLMGIESRMKASSMAESATMSILQRAMMKAHEKVGSKEGVIERLNEQSKFCEIAIMQLEGCLKLVEEEAGHYILENKYHTLLPDLAQIKNRLYGRLRETEIAIHNKDKELLERAINERTLKQALDAKQKELQTLRDTCSCMDDSHIIDTNEAEGDFSELKNSVHQQVLSIKQHLEGERIALTRRISEEGEVFDLDVENQSNNMEMGFDQMGLEIDKLKCTLDTAFQTMQIAISRSDVHPSEVQWMQLIENDIQSFLFKEFIVNVQATRFLNFEHCSELVNEVTLLRNELEGLVCNDDEFKDEDLNRQMDMDIDIDSEKGSPSSVAKMIQTHEKIIRKKSEELNWVKATEMVRDKGPLSPRRSKSLKKSADRVIKRVDEFLKWRGKLDQDGDHEMRAIKQEEDLNFQFSVREGIHPCFLKGLMRDFHIDLKGKIKDYRFKDVIKQDIDRCIFLETINNSQELIKAYQSQITEMEENDHNCYLKMKDKNKEELQSCEIASSLVLVFTQVIVNFEGMLQDKLDINNLRLQKMKDEMRPLLDHVGHLKKNELLYKEAFIRRCHNLHKAETEVDILGDQVEALTALLERIYSILDYYSPVLQHFIGVIDILMWIRKELNIV